MPHSSPAGTAVARLLTDAQTAFRLQDALAAGTDSANMAVSSSEEADGQWSLAIHFSAPPDQAALRAQVAAVAGTAAARALTFEMLAPTDWVRKSLDSLAPVTAGRFVVHGAHDQWRVRANQIGIQIEAALAFGTGHHGSTRGCLLALDRIAKRLSARRPRGREYLRATPGGGGARRLGPRRGILDLGTGSGVLAIAAAKVLRRRVLASDIDPRAVAIARDNLSINRVKGHVEVLRAAGVEAHRFFECSPFALILANILLDPLKQFATPIARLVAPNGEIVLSGLLTSQAASALASYRARRLVLVQRIALGGWTTLVLRRPALPARRPAHRLR